MIRMFGRASLNIVAAVAAMVAATLVGGGVFIIAMAWPAGLSALSDFLFGTKWLRPGVFSTTFILPAIPFAVVAFVLAVVAARRRIEVWLRNRPLGVQEVRSR